MAGTATLAAACGQAPVRELDGDVARRVDIDAPSEPDEPASRELFSGNGFINALGGRLEGAVGPATGLANNAETLNFYDDGFYTAADLTVRGEAGSAMGILSLNGSVSSFEAGDGVRTCQDDYNDPQSDLSMGGAAVFFTGCANDGDPGDGWEYDAPADCTDLEVDEPSDDAPEGTQATVSILAHWRASSYGPERTVKATLHLTER
jgi:hypothetical protein